MYHTIPFMEYDLLSQFLNAQEIPESEIEDLTPRQESNETIEIIEEYDKQRKQNARIAKGFGRGI